MRRNLSFGIDSSRQEDFIYRCDSYFCVGETTLFLSGLVLPGNLGSMRLHAEGSLTTVHTKVLVKAAIICYIDSI